MTCNHIEEIYNTYSDHIDLFINMIIFRRRISACTCAACDHIDFNMVMIIISVYIQKYTIINLYRHV